MFNYMERRKSGADCIRSSLRGELSNEWQIAWVRLCVCMKGCTNLSQAREKETPPHFYFNFKKSRKINLPARREDEGHWTTKSSSPANEKTLHTRADPAEESIVNYIFWWSRRGWPRKGSGYSCKRRGWEKKKKNTHRSDSAKKTRSDERGRFFERLWSKKPWRNVESGMKLFKAKKESFFLFFSNPLQAAPLISAPRNHSQLWRTNSIRLSKI